MKNKPYEAKNIRIRLDEPMYKRFLALKKRMGAPESYTGRQIIRDGIETTEKRFK
jgi:predicted DNA-binding protein